MTTARWRDEQEMCECGHALMYHTLGKGAGCAECSCSLFRLQAPAPPAREAAAPMSDDRFIELGAMHKAGWRGSHAFFYGRSVLNELYAEVARLRAVESADAALRDAAQRIMARVEKGELNIPTLTGHEAMLATMNDLRGLRAALSAPHASEDPTRGGARNE